MRATAAQLAREIEACDRQVAAFSTQAPPVAALLSTRGIMDWLIERGLILREIPLADWPDEWIGETKYRDRCGWPCRAYRTLGRKTALVEFFDGVALFTDAANVRERSAGANPLVGER